MLEVSQFTTLLLLQCIFIRGYSRFKDCLGGPHVIYTENDISRYASMLGPMYA